ncbi:hypothetical protein A0H81_02423 [Grifola frondosa]|uniref:Uncharacterized protein n=1 Tax=Grifola frondosa TaxID=5627 RepID=A0A1C7MMS4_GRIFR|nr:hypothetical protein A0H81_02423 [Grifola frondosa]
MHLEELSALWGTYIKNQLHSVSRYPLTHLNDISQGLIHYQCFFWFGPIPRRLFLRNEDIAVAKLGDGCLPDVGDGYTVASNSSSEVYEMIALAIFGINFWQAVFVPREAIKRFR